MQLTRRTVTVTAGVAAAIVLSALAFRPKPVAVETAAVSRGPLMTMVDEDARTRVVERYEISSPVSGRHVRVDLNPADPVKERQELVVVHAAPLDPRQLDELRKRYDAAEDLAGEARAAVRQAAALVKQADLERSRIEKLAESGIASPNDLDQARAAADTRHGELQATRARERAARHEMEVIRASLDAVAPGREGILTLRSPIAGRVLNVYHESEGVVQAGAPILAVGDPTSLEIVIDVLSREAPKVRVGQKVLIDGWGGDKPLEATVTRIEPSAFTKISALGIEEQRVNVIATLQEPPPSLGDRFEVQAHIVVWSGAALKVPATSVFRDGERWAVFAVRDKRARLQHIETGQRSSDEVEVTRGLQAKDEVIVHPSDQVRNGVRVTTRRS
jgi:HlyD family secretion protein